MKPVSVEKAIERFPTLRQSTLASFDDCALSGYFDATTYDYTTHPQAGGVLFHRFAAEVIRTCQAQDSEGIPVGEALVILEEVLWQRNVPFAERVYLPRRDIPLLRMTATKFAADNEFSIRRVIDVEKRLAAKVSYIDENGQKHERVLTGMPDLLVVDPRADDAIIVVDWKNTWGLPPEPPSFIPENKSETDYLSTGGYFQQRFYGLLCLREFPSVERVTMREFYPRFSVAREASLHRGQLESLEEEMAMLAYHFDSAVASGRPKPPKKLGGWTPSPGKHCAYCQRPADCPIDANVRAKYAVTTEEEAARAAAELEVADAIRESRRAGLRPWVEAHGPVVSKWSKGRRVFGIRPPRSKGASPSLAFFTPKPGDIPVRVPELDDGLEKAMETSVAEAREAMKA